MNNNSLLLQDIKFTLDILKLIPNDYALENTNLQILSILKSIKLPNDLALESTSQEILSSLDKLDEINGKLDLILSLLNMYTNEIDVNCVSDIELNTDNNTLIQHNYTLKIRNGYILDIIQNESKEIQLNNLNTDVNGTLKGLYSVVYDENEHQLKYFYNNITITNGIISDIRQADKATLIALAVEETVI